MSAENRDARIEGRIACFVTCDPSELPAARLSFALCSEVLGMLLPVFSGGSRDRFLLESAPIWVGIFRGLPDQRALDELQRAQRASQRHRLVYWRRGDQAADPVAVQRLADLLGEEPRLYRAADDLARALAADLARVLEGVCAQYDVLAEPPPLAHGSGTSVLERRWSKRREPLLTLGLPAGSSPPAAAANAKAIRAQLRRRAAAVADLPRAVYARLDAPAEALVGRELELTVGISDTPSSADNPEPMHRPSTSRGEYELRLQVQAHGFDLRAGESWSNVVRVTAADPCPAVLLHLTPGPQTSPSEARAIKVVYSVDGQPIGFAVHPLTVHATPLPAALPIERRPREQEVFGLRCQRSPPDLTVCLFENEGTLDWFLISPVVHTSAEPIRTTIGKQAVEYARSIVASVGDREGRSEVYEQVLGRGKEIARAVPAAFWSTLAAIQATKAAPPTVLLLSEEPYVPWEIAYVPGSIARDAGAPPLLAAQVSMGRWVLGAGMPFLPPPLSVTIRRLAVVSGVYERPGYARLMHAEDEAATIRSRYRGDHVEAVAEAVLGCLRQDPPTDLLHFAVHGHWDPLDLDNGVIMTDGTSLDPATIEGAEMVGNPFVFLNACQLAGGDRVLGDYAGIAASFLRNGASGVVAPLWSVSDDLAKDLALDFYLSSLEERQLPAEVLRTIRARFRKMQPSEGPSATTVAYQFFGHPCLQLERDPS